MPLELRSADYRVDSGVFVMLGSDNLNVSLQGQTKDHGRLLGRAVLIEAPAEYRDVSVFTQDDPEELARIVNDIAGKGVDPEHPERYVPDPSREARLIIPDMMEGLDLQFFELVTIEPPLHVPA